MSMVPRFDEVPDDDDDVIVDPTAAEDDLSQFETEDGPHIWEQWGFTDDPDKLAEMELIKMLRRGRRRDSMHTDRRVTELTRAAVSAAHRIGSMDPKIAFKSLTLLRHLCEQVQVRQVHRARRINWSWQAIGEALGLKRQTVYKKYASQIKEHNVYRPKAPNEVGVRARKARAQSEITAWYAGYGPYPSEGLD